MLYKGIKTREISFPLGGIGSGSIGLAGNGRLIDWEIFNRPAKNTANYMSHFAVKAEIDGKVVDARILQGDLQPPYTGEAGGTNFNGFGWGPNRSNLCGLPHFRNLEFKGEFPVAEISFTDELFPGTAKLGVWSPFVPGNEDDSSAPAACFEVELENTTDKTIDYTVVGVIANPGNQPTAHNKFTDDSGSARLFFSNGCEHDAFDYCDFTLSTPAGQDLSYQEYWYRGGWCDDLEVYWDDLNKPGKFTNRSYEDRSEGMKQDSGLLAIHFSLAPKEKQKAVFVLTWNVPNRHNDWKEDIEELAKKNGLENRWKNWYATRWNDSSDTASYLIDNYSRLRGDTFKFHDALFASSLPEVVLDAISANLAVLRSPTCLRVEDGTFYGWEGSGIDKGSCEGSCTHVWNYAQALPFLFPALERSMREANYKYNIDENGGSHFRINLPLGIKTQVHFWRPCVDGLCGDVMKTYRDWKISGDTDWLKQLWSSLKKTIEYIWSEQNYDHWDPGKTGVITGRQHHTLDMEMFGPSGWLNGHYLGALKAVAEMAAAMGESEFAEECRMTYAKGREWTDNNLFNGEYYYQKVDLKDKAQLNKFVRENDDPAERYWSEEHGELKYQIGEGCNIDMHLPQWYASLYGIGEIMDSEKIDKTLESIYHNNFRSMRDVANTWRNYALNDESGVMICTWPEGTIKPVIPVPYASEMMHGFEWAFACHLLMKGKYSEGMSVVKGIRDRYDGEKRNPWNEIECGSNYARSMASYALLNAFSGFEFDLTRGMIGFTPQYTDDKPFKCFWSLGSAWGEYSSENGRQEITLCHGYIELKELRLSGTMNSISTGFGALEFTRFENGCFFSSPLKMSVDGHNMLAIE